MLQTICDTRDRDTVIHHWLVRPWEGGHDNTHKSTVKKNISYADTNFTMLSMEIHAGEKKIVLQKKTDCVNKGMSIRNAAGL